MSNFIDELLWKMHGEWPGSGRNRDACVLCDDTPDVEGYITGAGPIHDRHDLADIVREALEQGDTAITNTELWTLESVPVAYVHAYPDHLVVAVPFWAAPGGAPTTAPATEATWIDVLLDLWGYSDAAGREAA